MKRSVPLPKPLLMTLALVFSAVVVLYSSLWMYSIRWQARVELGLDFNYVQALHAEHVRSVQPGSPAAKAGLKPGDLVLAVNGRPFKDRAMIFEVWSHQKPGNTIALSVLQPGGTSPVTLKAVFRAHHSASKLTGLTERLGQEILRAYPLVFLIVGLPVLFLRIEDRNAWLLALMFACYTAAPPFPSMFRALAPSLHLFAAAYRGFLDAMLGAVFYCFFALFPARSFLDRHAPWLKWTGFVMGLCFALPGLRVGDPRVPAVFVELLGANVSRHAPWVLYNYGFISLGLVALVGNGLAAPTAEARRKFRIILWGTLVGVVPIVSLAALSDLFRTHPPIPLIITLSLLLFIFPLSFGYAVVKHHVLEVPVLLRRGARYLLVLRGFTILLALVSIGVTLLFARLLAPYMELFSGGVPGGIALGAGFGTVLLWAGMAVHKRVGEKIDRAFFRNAYDARLVLEKLVEISRTATDRDKLSDLLQRHLEQALSPNSLVVYLETANRQISVTRGDVPSGLAVLSPEDPLLQELARRARPWEIANEDERSLPSPLLLAPLQPACLVPIPGRDKRLTGLLALGARLSEEPYSREDLQLLAAVAAQAGIALESIRLGEEIAERLEAERRTTQEMDFARQVQSRLFPQKFPALRTLEYAGGCAPARDVGGDYYDFLELRPGRLALVLADIAGKGVSGALLMANLQANLRSQYALALDDIRQLLTSVNRLFYENTSDNSYATLFFADYDDATRCLRYVNCGHLPPLLLRGCAPSAKARGSDRNIERLEPTSTVLGLFENWKCVAAEAHLDPGDTLVLYTDGITEATSPADQEFGESRLLATLFAHHDLAAQPLLDSVIQTVQQFSGQEQADDITLVVAHCREPHRVESAGSNPRQH